VVTLLFQILAFMEMEPATALAPGPIHEEKNKVFRSMLCPAAAVRAGLAQPQPRRRLTPGSRLQASDSVAFGQILLPPQPEPKCQEWTLTGDEGKRQRTCFRARSRTSCVGSPSTGGLVEVLSEWMPSYPGYCLYYPGRRHMAASSRVFVDLAQEIVFRNRAKAS
jgi:hypothetical protein